jgi:hypothetical protein
MVRGPLFSARKRHMYDAVAASMARPVGATISDPCFRADYGSRTIIAAALIETSGHQARLPDCHLWVRSRRLGFRVRRTRAGHGNTVIP